MTDRGDSVETKCMLAPFCPAPKRVAASHWMSHLPFAFWLIDILCPSMLVELGAYTGVSFCAFCQQIEQLGIPCEAYAVDLWQGDAHMGEYGENVFIDLKAYVEEHYSGFACLVRSSFDAALKQFQEGSVDLLHLDGCHTREAILHDFEVWLPKMSNRGVILIHDTRARIAGYGGVAAWEEICQRFPAFVFNHGYGLGVVLTGKNVPQSLREIAAMDRSGQAKLTSLFQQQGKIYEVLFALEARREKEVAAAKAVQADMQGEIREYEKILASEREAHAKECQVYKEEREHLKEALLHAELKAQAYAGSLSWKITAPLRKLAGMCRR